MLSRVKTPDEKQQKIDLNAQVNGQENDKTSADKKSIPFVPLYINSELKEVLYSVAFNDSSQQNDEKKEAEPPEKFYTEEEMLIRSFNVPAFQRFSLGQKGKTKLTE